MANPEERSLEQVEAKVIQVFSRNMESGLSVERLQGIGSDETFVQV